jgi:hypothetical protein
MVAKLWFQRDVDHLINGRERRSLRERIRKSDGIPATDKVTKPDLDP